MNVKLLVNIFILVLFGQGSFGRNMHCKRVIIRDSTRKLLPHDYFDSDIEDDPNDEYDLLVSNSGPAVHGSEISFEAEIKNKKGHQVGDIKQFKYIWTNDADDYEFEKTDNFNASFSRSFYDVEARIYKMKVCVYNLVQSGKTFQHLRVAQNMTSFNVTEYLNGMTESKQNLPHLLKKNVYETNDIVHFKVNLTDKFDVIRYNDYMWVFKYGTREIRIPTKVPEVTYNSSFVGNHVLDLFVKSYPVMEEIQETLEGNFHHKFVLKDKVSSAEIHLENRQDTGLLPVGEELTFNVTYLGSNPTVICWNVIQENNTITDIGENCSEPIIGDNNSYLLSFQLDSDGEHFINVSVRNDVSQFLETKYFYGYDPDSSGYVSTAIPVVFSILGLFVIVFGAVYIVRIKRKTSIEVADFDFHPSLHHGDTHPYIRAIKYKFHTLISRNLYSNTHKHPSHVETTAKNYGSVLSSSQMLEYL